MVGFPFSPSSTSQHHWMQLIFLFITLSVLGFWVSSLWVFILPHWSLLATPKDVGISQVYSLTPFPPLSFLSKLPPTIPNMCFHLQQFSSVAQSCPTLLPHGLQHVRLPCSSPTHRVRSNSCPLSQRCHPTILSSVFPFSSCFQSLRSFPMSQFFTSGGQSIGDLASALLLTMNIQDWCPLGLTCLISLQSKGLSRVFSNSTVQKHQFHPTSPQNSRHRSISLPKTLFSIQPLYHPIIDFTSSFLCFSKCFTHSPHCSIQSVFFSCPLPQYMTKS